MAEDEERSCALALLRPLSYHREFQVHPEEEEGAMAQTGATVQGERLQKLVRPTAALAV